ncbi:MAG: hypothetical protein AABZ62_01885, partial [Planctomycetota bacterium]
MSSPAFLPHPFAPPSGAKELVLSLPKELVLLYTTTQSVRFDTDWDMLHLPYITSPSLAYSAIRDSPFPHSS